MILEVQCHAIPHFKARTNGKCQSRGPRRGKTFILCQAIFKNPVLLRTEGLVPFILISSVNNNLFQFLQILRTFKMSLLGESFSKNNCRMQGCAPWMKWKLSYSCPENKNQKMYYNLWHLDVLEMAIMVWKRPCIGRIIMHQ